MADSATHLLVDLDWLDAVTASVLLVDARPAADYARGHLLGAINLDTFFYVNERTDAAGLRTIEADWARMLGEAGITPEDTVVFYDGGTQNFAPRGAFMLRYLGHGVSHIFHGGFAGWRAAGRPVTTAPPERQPTPGKTYPVNPQRAMIATSDEVAVALHDPNVVVLDVRADDEYFGRREMQGNPRLGHLPGVAHIVWTDLIGEDDRFKAPDGDARDPRRRGRRAGERDSHPLPAEPPRDEHLHRAGILGYPHVRVAIGSFYEWSRRADLPVEKP